MRRSRAFPWEIGVSGALVTLCLAVLWETRRIPPGRFEPLGSAPVPQATAILIILLSLVVAVRAARTPGGEDEPLAYAPRPLDAWVVAALTVGYVLAMQARVMGFAPLTTLFLVATIGFLTRFRLRRLPLVVLVSAITGWGCAFVFTRVFIVDLPGL